MLKELLDYLNKEIYPNMPAKKVKEIKEASLGGGLMDIIRKYKNLEVQKALDIQREEHNRDTKSFKDCIDRLRRGVKEDGKKYRMGGEKYNGKTN